MGDLIAVLDKSADTRLVVLGTQVLVLETDDARRETLEVKHPDYLVVEALDVNLEEVDALDRHLVQEVVERDAFHLLGFDQLLEIGDGLACESTVARSKDAAWGAHTGRPGASSLIL